MSYELITSAADLPKVAQMIFAAQVLGLDIETTSLDPREGKIRLVQVDDGTTAYVIDVFLCGTLGTVPQALGESKAIKIIQNAKFEQKWFKFHHGIDLWPIFDTFRASEIIYNGKNVGHGLYDLYARELDSFPNVDDMSASNWGGALTKEQYDYARDDVAKLHPLRNILKSKLLEGGLNPTALVEFGAVLPEAECELNGFFLDSEAWLALVETNKEGAETMRKKLVPPLAKTMDQMSFAGIDPPFNLDSNDQIVKALQRLGLKRKIKIEKDGASTTKVIPIDTSAEIILAQYAADYPIVKDLFKYREYSKNLSAFGEKYLKHISKKTGRIHCNYFPFTGAGRYSCDSPNLAQIPRNKAFRACFKAESGKQLIVADYSGVEMRIIAEFAPDLRLLQAFNDNKDAHTNTAALLNGLSYEQVAAGIKKEDPSFKLMRQQSKAVNFGLCIAAGQLVLTNAGLIPIERVEKNHMVWDGIDWVRHDGVVFMGYREVISYGGLTATHDHEVYTNDGYKIPFRAAASSIYSGRLAVGEIGGVPVRYPEAYDKNPSTSAKSEVRGGFLFSLLEDEMDPCGQYSRTSDKGLHVSERQIQGSKSPHARRALRRDGSAVLSGYARFVPSLQGQGDSGALCVEGTLHTLGTDHVSRYGFRWSGFRQDRQQRALLPRKSTTDDIFRESAEQGVLAPVFDILNAGPRHRFTVSGKVVSNCYGMGWEKLILYAMANYGVTLTQAQAQDFRTKYFRSFDGVARWHQRAVRDGQRLGHVRTMNGRIRYLPPDAYSEWMNTSIQGTGADALKKALRNVVLRLRAAVGPRARLVHHVHDEIILEVDDDADVIAAAKSELVEGMKDGLRSMLKRVPADVEAHSGKTWADAK